MRIYERYKSNEKLSSEEAAKLLPSREEFAAAWRYLKRNARGSELEDDVTRLLRGIAGSVQGSAETTKFLICLEVFSEFGLIETAGKGRTITVHIMETTGKVDLNGSVILERLRRAERG